MVLLVDAALARPTVDLGLGVRQASTSYDQWPIGVHAAGRIVLTPRFAVELSGTVRLPTDEVNGLAIGIMEAAFHWEAGFELPVEREVGALTLLAEGSPWKTERREGLSVWPYAALGTDIRAARTDYASMTDEYGNPTNEVTLREGRIGMGVSAAGGLGFDVWFGKRVGTRILWLERVTLEEQPDTSSAVAVDFLVAI